MTKMWQQFWEASATTCFSSRC